MQKILLLLFISIPMIVIAQVPQGMNYQAVARNNQGSVLSSTQLNIRFSILDSTTNGPVVYSEVHTTTTNDYGMFTLVIGKGTPQLGNFTLIKWSVGDKFLKVEIGDNGVSYDLQTTTQLLSVPYALFARNTTINPGFGITIIDRDTIAIDTFLVATKYWRQKGLDSMVTMIRLDNYTTGDGITDDTDGILAAIAEAKLRGLELVGTAGKTYRFSPKVESDITGIPSFRNISFDMSSVIGDRTKATPNSIEAVFKITGEKAKLSSNVVVNKGQNQLSLPAGLQVAPGDILFVTSSQTWVQPVFPSYYRGQRVMVNKYDASTGIVTVYEPFYENIQKAYVWKNTTVPSFSVQNCHFRTASNNELICFYSRFANIKVDNSIFKNFGYAAIALNSSEGHFEGTQIFNSNKAGNGLSYGIAVWDLSKAFINNVHIEGGRHCITGGGGRTWFESEMEGINTTDGMVFPGEYYINGGYFAGDNSQGDGIIDAHGNTWMASIKNITAKGGLFLGAVHNIIENVQIETKRQFGIAITYGFDSSSTTIINNVSIVAKDFPNVPFIVSQKLKSLRINNLIITGNLTANITPVNIAEKIGDLQIDGLSLNLTSSVPQTNYATFNVWNDVNWKNINISGISTMIVPKVAGIKISLHNSSFNNSPWAYGLFINGTSFKPSSVVYDFCTFQSNHLAGSLVNTARSLLVRNSFIRDNGTNGTASINNRSGIFAAAVDTLGFYFNETSPLATPSQTYGIAHTAGIAYKLADNKFKGNTISPGYLVSGTSQGIFGNTGDAAIKNIIPSAVSIGGTTSPAYTLDVVGISNAAAYMLGATTFANKGGGGANTNIYVGSNALQFVTADGATSVFSLSNTGSASLYRNLTLRAGSTNAGTAPLKFLLGQLTSVIENGAMEFNGANYFLSANGVRSNILTNADTLSISTRAWRQKGIDSLIALTVSSTLQHVTDNDSTTTRQITVPRLIVDATGSPYDPARIRLRRVYGAGDTSDAEIYNHDMYGLDSLRNNVLRTGFNVTGADTSRDMILLDIEERWAQPDGKILSEFHFGKQKKTSHGGLWYRPFMVTIENNDGNSVDSSVIDVTGLFSVYPSGHMYDPTPASISIREDGRTLIGVTALNNYGRAEIRDYDSTNAALRLVSQTNNEMPASGLFGKLDFAKRNGNTFPSLARIGAKVIDLTPNAESGELIFQTMRTGKLTTALTLKSTGNVEPAANIILSGSGKLSNHTSPLYPVDIAGYINASTGYAVGGNAKLISGGFYSNSTAFNVYKNDGSKAMLRIDNTSDAAVFAGTVTSTKFFVSAMNTPPSSASDTGTAGEIRITTDYIYICVATNTWKRVALSSW